MPLGVWVGSGCVSNPSVFLDFNRCRLLDAHVADSTDPLFCFGFRTLFPYSFCSTTFYLCILEDTNEHSLWSTEVCAWQWCGDRNRAGAFVTFSACRLHRWSSVMELQRVFTVCRLTRVLRVFILWKGLIFLLRNLRRAPDNTGTLCLCTCSS